MDWLDDFFPGSRAGRCADEDGRAIQSGVYASWLPDLQETLEFLPWLLPLSLMPLHDSVRSCTRPGAQVGLQCCSPPRRLVGSEIFSSGCIEDQLQMLSDGVGCCRRPLSQVSFSLQVVSESFLPTHQKRIAQAWREREAAWLATTRLPGFLAPLRLHLKRPAPLPSQSVASLTHCPPLLASYGLLDGSSASKSGSASAWHCPRRAFESAPVPMLR